MRLASLRKRLEQHTAELALLDRARTLGHASAALRYSRGVALMYNRHLEDAEAELASSLRDAPGRGRVAVPLVGLRRQTADHNYLDALDAGARVAAAGTEDQAAFGFAQYRTLEGFGRHDEAWQALARGSALMHARLHDKSAQHHAWLERLLAAASSIEPSPAREPSTGPMPIFIIGVPRSGSTLLERMLANHSAVAPAGELTDFGRQLHWVADTANTHSDAFIARLGGLDLADVGRRYLAQTRWRARGKAFFIDKQPPNWAMAGLIHAALPGVRILRVFDFCGLPWEPGCGDITRNTAPSATLSAAQVRAPVHTRAFDEWRCYAPQLAPLEAALAVCDTP